MVHAIMFMDAFPIRHMNGFLFDLTALVGISIQSWKCKGNNPRVKVVLDDGCHCIYLCKENYLSQFSLYRYICKVQSNRVGSIRRRTRHADKNR